MQKILVLIYISENQLIYILERGKEILQKILQGVCLKTTTFKFVRHI